MARDFLCMMYAMPSYRKRTPTYRRRSPAKRTRMIRRMTVPRSVNRYETHFFKRSVAGSPINGAAGFLPYLAGTSTSLGVLPNVSEFANLFDQYMITHWQLRFYLSIDPSAQAAASAVYPRLFWCPDNDDVAIPSSLNELRERSKTRTRILTPSRPVIVNVKPSVLNEVYRGLGTITYSPKWKQWIDMSNTDVPHYGLKWAIDNLTNTNYSLNIEQVMWFRCKNVR